MRLIIVSNRLPVTLDVKDGEILFRESIGGLATGISSYLKTVPDTKFLWIGWPGNKISHLFGREVIKRELSKNYQAEPVFLSEEAVKKYYTGFCNRTLWPLLHSFPQFVKPDEDEWKAYVEQNEKFADVVADSILPGDVVWIHDFHLMLLPKMLRYRGVRAPIGFFSHIPFPKKEIFDILPQTWRSRLIEGVSAADQIGFHTDQYSENFKESAREFNQRELNVKSFPISIDFNKFDRAQDNSEVKRAMVKFEEVLPKDTIKLLSIDRLDYIKGVKERLLAYKLLLTNHPEWRGKITLLDFVVPSREDVPENIILRAEIQALVAEINYQFSSEEWSPIFYQYRALPFEEMAALYKLSDVALVTPLIDGMNLVAKEYVAARSDLTGVLVLGKGAGAAAELKEAIIVNPEETVEFSEKLNVALSLNESEKVVALKKMRKHIEENNITKWANSFIASLLSTRMVKLYANQNSAVEHFLQGKVK